MRSPDRDRPPPRPSPHKGERERRRVRAKLQRAVPGAEIHVRLAHLDAMLTRVAHELGRLVEAHRLAVENRGAEDVRVVAFDPGRHIDEEREARRVAFGKTVLAEALDLPEAVFGEFAIVAPPRHAVDELVAKQMDVAVVAEGRHGAAQPVGLVGREAGGRDRDLHRLLLEQRHAEGAPEHLLQLVGRPMRRIGRGIIRLFGAVAPAQIGMHHVALDRPRAHDRDLDDEVVEFPRLEARQHRHLRAALDLEHADRVGARQHVVDRRVVLRHGGERDTPCRDGS